MIGVGRKVAELSGVSRPAGGSQRRPLGTNRWGEGFATLQLPYTKTVSVSPSPSFSIPLVLSSLSSPPVHLSICPFKPVSIASLIPSSGGFARGGKKLKDASISTVERILIAGRAGRRATNSHLSRPGALQAGGRLESRGARRRRGRCGPGLRRCPPTAAPRDRQHEQARRINKWVPLRQPRGSRRVAWGGQAGRPGRSFPELCEFEPQRGTLCPLA
ncbi:hypothetical protein ACRRTK_001176 [Alexandromys fortis]